MTTQKVTARSTKQELWEAYNQLLAKIEKEPVEFETAKKEIVSPDALRNLAELKLKIGQELDKAGEILLGDLNELHETRNNITNIKRRLIEHFEDQKESLENEIAKVKEQWREQEKNHQEQLEEKTRQEQLARRREEDEYQYNLEFQRRKENEQYSRREEILKERENEIIEMEKEFAQMPETIVQEVDKAKSQLGKELTDKHNLELRETKLDFEREKKIYELKIANLDSSIGSQNKEIIDLKKQLTNASNQLKEIAVSVIENKNRPVDAQGEKKEKVD